MQLDKEKFRVVKKLIAGLVDTSDEITEVLVLLARIPNEEWETIITNGKHHRKALVTGVCGLCSSTFQTFRTVNADICDTCQSKFYDEIHHVNMHRRRARVLGLPATLRITEWVTILEHFKYLCAYCQVNKYEALDHFIPLFLGGGTVASNCVPSCGKCNRKKMRSHPDKVVSIPRGDIERVYEFLQSFKIAS